MLALAELMATLRDWLTTCQPMVPAVCDWGLVGWENEAGGMRTYAETGLEHAGRDDQVREDERRHAEGQHDRFPGIYRKVSL